MMRDRFAAWLTLAFAVVLFLLALSEEPRSAGATLLLGVLAVGAVAVFLRMEQRAVHRPRLK